MYWNDLGRRAVRLLTWIRYSGARIGLTVNPCQWAWIPRAYVVHDIWCGPRYRGVHVAWLMVDARFWIDDASW